MVSKSIKIGTTTIAEFKSKPDFCIGTGRIGLALQREYFDQLKYVQEQLHFKYIRGHGLLSDDIGIYHEYEDDSGVHLDLNFTYVDRIFDMYRELNVRPFLELGFMPNKLSDSKETVFYWKGNIGFPKNEDLWTELIDKLLRHFIERYGIDEVLQWPIEVWNEPNATTFWVNADLDKYLRLFEITFKAIKNVNSNFRVGGPAVSGIENHKWIQSFVNFCETEKLDVDFVTQHLYASFNKKQNGKYSYFELREPGEVVSEAKDSLSIINASKKFNEIPLYITEYNSTYRPDSPVHDTLANAIYVTKLTLSLMKTVNGFSYWTFGDVFEEHGVPTSQFYGGFGLVANHTIAKPTLWAQKFMNDLYESVVNIDENGIVTRHAEGIRGIVWNDAQDEDLAPLQVKIDLSKFADGDYIVTLKKLDDDHGNPIKVWHDLGDHQFPTQTEIKILKSVAKPEISTIRLSKSRIVTFNLSKNTLLYFDIRPAKLRISDRGYHYDWMK